MSGSCAHRAEPRCQWDAGPGVERDIDTLRAATIVFAAALPAVEVWYVAIAPDAQSFTLLALLSAALVIPLHLRLVWRALHGTPSPNASVTLAVLALVIVGAGIAIGAPWVKMLALVGGSGLIVLPRRAAVGVLIGSVAAAALLAALVDPTRHPSATEPAGTAYLALSVAWRSIAVFALVWLVASYRGLVSARGALRREAVDRERQRVHSELAVTVDATLGRLVALSHQFDTLGPSDAAAMLVRINRDADDALGRTRQLIAGYRASTREFELRTAIGLLAAAGITAELLVDGADLTAPADATFRTQLRTAVQQAIDDESAVAVALRVRSDHGSTVVELWAPTTRNHAHAT